MHSVNAIYDSRALKLGIPTPTSQTDLPTDRSEHELLTCDEYDIEDYGKCFTDNPMMTEKYICWCMYEIAKEEGLYVYMRELALTHNTNSIPTRIRKRGSWRYGKEFQINLYRFGAHPSCERNNIGFKVIKYINKIILEDPL